MKIHAICPYYASGRDYCNIGIGIISGRDADIIKKHCSKDYQSCSKFRELREQHHDNGEVLGEILIPVILPEVKTGRTDNNNVALGLTGGGLAVLVYILHLAGLLGASGISTFLLMLAAAFLQFAAGITALRARLVRGNMFIGGGIFWTSLLALNILPQTGHGAMANTTAMTGFLIIWSLFYVLPLSAGLLANRACRYFYGLSTVLLLLLAIEPFLTETVRILIYSIGITTALSGLISGGQYLKSTVGRVSRSRSYNR